MPLASGTRFAFVFFCQKKFNERTPGAMHAYLTKLGFKLPSEAILRASPTEVMLVDWALGPFGGKAVKEEPCRKPLPKVGSKLPAIVPAAVQVKQEAKGDDDDDDHHDDHDGNAQQHLVQEQPTKGK